MSFQLSCSDIYYVCSCFLFKKKVRVAVVFWPGWRSLKISFYEMKKKLVQERCVACVPVWVPIHLASHFNWKNHEQNITEEICSKHLSISLIIYSHCILGAMKFTYLYYFLKTPQLLLKYHQKTQLPKTQSRVRSYDCTLVDRLCKGFIRRVQARCQWWAGVNGMWLEFGRLEKFLYWLSLAVL